VIRSATLSSLLLLSATADEVMLRNGSQLTGMVTELADSGEVRLQSDLAFEPFRIRAESLRQVTFSSDGDAWVDEHDAMVELANRDRFPADLLAIDADSVTLGTGFAGEIRIPRSQVTTIQLGVRPLTTVFAGPDGAGGWTIRNGWRFDSRRFTTEERGSVAREFDQIPGSFSLKFQLSWRNSPNIRVHFAADSLDDNSKVNRYYLQFASMGFELKRQQAGEGQRYLTMATIPRTPQEFPDSKVEVELLVDRKLGKVHVLIDGEEEGLYSDPVKTPPAGQGIMFESMIGGEDSQSIERIEVRSWDASSNRHRQEERGDETKDALITRSSDRGTVSIVSMTRGADGTGTIRYKTPHHPEPVDLPLAEISTLFFARPAETPEIERPPLVLSLRGRGSLRMTGCRMDGGRIAARHPLLGELSIRMEAVAAIDRKPARPAEEEDEEPVEEAGTDEEEL
jgi:hypothetical protein